MPASEGTISPRILLTGRSYAPAGFLEAIPGLVISQHSGEGKANQYYLRGFQLDHGTDLESTIGGIPINMVSHAHGQGYSDINWLMPETVGFVEFKKARTTPIRATSQPRGRITSTFVTRSSRSRRSVSVTSDTIAYSQRARLRSAPAISSMPPKSTTTTARLSNLTNITSSTASYATHSIAATITTASMRSLTTAPSTRPTRFRSGSSMPASSAPTAMSTQPTAAIRTATPCRLNGNIRIPTVEGNVGPNRLYRATCRMPLL